MSAPRSSRASRRQPMSEVGRRPSTAANGVARYVYATPSTRMRRSPRAPDGIPGRDHAGRMPTRRTSWPRSASAAASARACASEPPTDERSFFAMTIRTRRSGYRGGLLTERELRLRGRADHGARVGGLDAIHHQVPIPLRQDLGLPALAHRAAERRILDEARDRVRDLDRPLRYEKTMVADHFAHRRDVAADDRLAVEPGLEVAEPERLVLRRHGEEVTGVERSALLLAARALDVDDPVVGVADEVVDERRVEARDADEDVARLGVLRPHQLRRIQELDVALVSLLASDIEDDRCVVRDAAPPPPRLPVAGADGVRSHAGRHDPCGLDPVADVPGSLPIGHRRDGGRLPVAPSVGRAVAAVELARVRERREDDGQIQLLRDV